MKELPELQKMVEDKVGDEYRIVEVDKHGDKICRIIFETPMEVVKSNHFVNDSYYIRNEVNAYCKEHSGDFVKSYMIVLYIPWLYKAEISL